MRAPERVRRIREEVRTQFVPDGLAMQGAAGNG
jgi:hypothetical protein